MMVATARVRVLASVTRDAWDEAQMELVCRKQEAIALCDSLEPRLTRLHGATVHLGPRAEQLAAGALHDVRSYRERNKE